MGRPLELLVACPERSTVCRNATHTGALAAAPGPVWQLQGTTVNPSLRPAEIAWQDAAKAVSWPAGLARARSTVKWPAAAVPHERSILQPRELHLDSTSAKKPTGRSHPIDGRPYRPGTATEHYKFRPVNRIARRRFDRVGFRWSLTTCRSGSGEANVSTKSPFGLPSSKTPKTTTRGLVVMFVHGELPPRVDKTSEPPAKCRRRGSRQKA